MTTQILAWLANIRSEIIELNNPEMTILDVGALDINGSARLIWSNPEHQKNYIGIDMQAGKGVDQVLNAHDIHKVFYQEQFDLVLCLETFEHDDQFWITLEQLRDVTKRGGHMIISTPTFGFPIHRHPRDYYRFGTDIYEDLFYKDWTNVRIDTVISKGVNPGLIAIGKKL